MTCPSALGSSPTPAPTIADALASPVMAHKADCCPPQSDAVGQDCHADSFMERSPTDDCGSSNLVDAVLDSERPECCDGKPSPCCDTSCIDRMAVRECANENSKTSGASSDCDHGDGTTPCQKHTQSVQEKYQATLDALGCICRMLLQLGQESCCSQSRRASLQRKSYGSRVSFDSCKSVDTCCIPNASMAASKAKTRHGGNKLRSTTKTDACAEVCCDEKHAAKTVAGPSSLKASHEYAEASSQLDEIRVDTRHDTDLETRPAVKDRVTLSISGMTCTGCETKVSRTLAKLPAITNLKSSLILSRAEFDLDVGIMTANEVIKHLERTTEFKYDRISNQDSGLDLICPGDPSLVFKDDWPIGVTDMKVVGQMTVRVAFDAKIVGARDLVEKGWSTPMRLAPPCVDPTTDVNAQHVRRVGLMTLLSIALTIPVLILTWAPLPDKASKTITFGSVSLALATIVQVVVAGPFYSKALKALIFSRVIEMDLLIIMSTSAAYVFSVVEFALLLADDAHDSRSNGEYFATSTLLVTLIMVGRYVAALARQKAVESISIRSLQSSTATLMDQNIEREIDTRLLQYGDTFRVFPDSKVPTDGTVVSGTSEIDESMITGESRPIVKSHGSTVIAGSINGSGALTVRLIRIPGDNTISAIAGMVDEAKLSKPKVQEIADRVASFFVPVVISIAVIVFCTWIAIGMTVQHKTRSQATVQAVLYAITVLIVSCPCAIGLAVPMVVVVATGVAAESGVIFKSADAIEVALKTSHVVFDKTGTLTRGKLTVARAEYTGSGPDTKRLLLGLVGDSKHPVSVAVATHLRADGVEGTAVTDFRSVIGNGVEGISQGLNVRAGNSRWLNVSDDPLAQSVLSQGHTAFCFTVDGSLAAIFGLADVLREDTFDTITRLQAKGIAVHVLSGDDDGAVLAVASRLNIPTANVQSRCSPADKKAYIDKLLMAPDSRGKKPTVMFCGDGTNDAVALAQATIGVHMNEGTDVAQSAADVVLMRPRLSGIITAITISRKSIQRIAFNFGWSFVYNVFAVLLAAGAFVHVRIPPEYAGLGELVSVLPVIAAGVLLRWAKVERT